MKVKPKEVLLNLPIALLFDTQDEADIFASNINTLINGKVKVKMDNVGILGEKHVTIYYLQRNDEYSEIRDEFLRMIEQEEMGYQAEP
jgi:hypothetical protein